MDSALTIVPHSAFPTMEMVTVSTAGDALGGLGLGACCVAFGEGDGVGDTEADGALDGDSSAGAEGVGDTAGDDFLDGDADETGDDGSTDEDAVASGELSGEITGEGETAGVADPPSCMLPVICCAPVALDGLALLSPHPAKSSTTANNKTTILFTAASSFP
ncbi:hypothetical protein SD71_18855 [Cohnella kolymensis]|uniref:Uncharacterized protein n=2 Tax=Cohnella kolymensis TaxID=1590652 RepID=A0ABR5A0F2_9BACL|nr:hypothetical protein SD71_18855 [Cohnella kolymensis]